jgi:hypothetical protein
MEDEPKQGSSVSHMENQPPGTTACRERASRWERYRPELAKVVSLIEVKLLQADLFPKRHQCPAVDDKLDKIKANPDWCKSLNTAHEVNHQVNQLLPLIATDEYLYVLLEYELKRREEPEGRFLITQLFDEAEITHLRNRLRNALDASKGSAVDKLARENMTDLRRLLLLTIRFFQGTAKLSSGSNAQEPHELMPHDRLRAQQFLKRLYEARDEGWTYERALVKLKRYYLLFYAIVVGIFLVPLGEIIMSASGTIDQLRNQFLLVTLVGALGSTLAAMLKLRDTVVRLNSFLLVLVAAIVQALIGASLGLVAWLLLRSGAVQIGGGRITDWETYALVAFASGFSEPFSLRLIGRFIETS